MPGVGCRGCVQAALWAGFIGTGYRGGHGGLPCHLCSVVPWKLDKARVLSPQPAGCLAGLFVKV